jgi:hypothetical protein
MSSVVVQRQPGELLTLLQGLAGSTAEEGHLMDVLGWTHSLLSADSSASLTLLPGLLGLVSEGRSRPRSLLINCLSKILRVAANFEPTTAIAGESLPT